jgi:hypothetical protein
MDNPGIWMIHDHIDTHVNNGDKHDGGVMTVIAYDGVEPAVTDDSHSMLADDDPDFYYSESMKKPYGMYDNPHFKGTPLQAEGRRERRRAGHDGGMDHEMH